MDNYCLLFPVNLGKIKGVRYNFGSPGEIALVLRLAAADRIVSVGICVDHVFHVTTISHVDKAPVAQVVDSKGLVAFVNTILSQGKPVKIIVGIIHFIGIRVWPAKRKL